MSVYANLDIPAKLSKEEETGYTVVSSVADCSPLYYIHENGIVREMTPAEKAIYYPISLDDAKQSKSAAIESKTDTIYEAGTPAHVNTILYRFDTQTGKRAATRWKTLDSVIWRGKSGVIPEAYMFPMNIESITDAEGGYYKTIIVLATCAAADTFYTELMQNDQNIATAGTTLLLQVEAATTVEQVNAIVDNRPIPYVP
jgi:hypothetical protein